MPLIINGPEPQDESDYIVLPPLTLQQVRFVAYHAIDRRISCMKEGRSRYDQPYIPTWDDEIEPANAEYALSLYKGVPWTGLADFRAPDCGGEDVRWTKWEDGYLAIQPREDPNNERPLVLMDGMAPCYRIIGWLYRREGMQKNFWREDHKRYGVPRKYLHPYERVLL